MCPSSARDAAGNTSYYPEQMILAAPDVIFCTATSGEADDIQAKTNIPVVAVSQGTLFGKDFEQSLRIIGEVCGVSDGPRSHLYINEQPCRALRARLQGAGGGKAHRTARRGHL